MSCVMVNEVCILNARPHSPGIENTLRVEALFYPLGESKRGRFFRRKYVNGGSHRGWRADQGGMSTDRSHGTTDRSRIRLAGERHRHPYEATGPVIEHLRRGRNGGGDLVTATWGH